MADAAMITVVVCAVLAGLVTAHTAVNARLLRRPPPPRAAGPAPPQTAPAGRAAGPAPPQAAPAGRVAVLLPLRDEVHRVEACLRSLLAQRGVARLELIVLDDGSTDGTAALVRAVGGDRVRLLTGVAPPRGWLGKPHACHLLATATTAEVLVFVDADVVLAPDAVAAAVALLDGFALLTPYPRIVTGGWGRVAQPLLQWSWLAFLPLRAMERSARPSLAAAGGQFLVVRRAAYVRAGGHAAVRDRVLEDVALARAVKRSGGRITLADGSALASCRMYGTWRELVDGYTKSLWAAFGCPVGAAAVVGLLGALYVVPALAAVGGWLVAPGVGLAGTAGYLLGVAGRVVAAGATGGRAWPDALAHPMSVVVFGWLVARSYRRRRSVTWKGRRVVVR